MDVARKVEVGWLSEGGGSCEETAVVSGRSSDDVPAGEVLAGGFTSGEVVRLGDTVRRDARPWTATVHDFLRHLHARGFQAAPVPQGLDEQGREVLSWVPGEAGTYPLSAAVRSDETLVAVAELIARFHDAAEGFVPSGEATWRRRALAPAAPQLVVHNDLGPYNVVFDGSAPVAIIDWDFAAPGTRMWDLAYAAYRFVPLCDDEHVVAFGWEAPPDRRERLALFCEAYGGQFDRALLLDVLVARLADLAMNIVLRDRAGDPGFVVQAAEAHQDAYRRDVAFVSRMRESWW